MSSESRLGIWGKSVLGRKELVALVGSVVQLLFFLQKVGGLVMALSGRRIQRCWLPVCGATEGVLPVSEKPGSSNSATRVPDNGSLSVTRGVFLRNENENEMFGGGLHLGEHHDEMRGCGPLSRGFSLFCWSDGKAHCG